MVSSSPAVSKVDQDIAEATGPIFCPSRSRNLKGRRESLSPLYRHRRFAAPQASIISSGRELEKLTVHNGLSSRFGRCSCTSATNQGTREPKATTLGAVVW
eukprot:Filipodium_phascolosomae@DN8259_c0_g1_i1.p1